MNDQGKDRPVSGGIPVLNMWGRLEGQLVPGPEEKPSDVVGVHGRHMFNAIWKPFRAVSSAFG